MYIWSPSLSTTTRDKLQECRLLYFSFASIIYLIASSSLLLIWSKFYHYSVWPFQSEVFSVAELATTFVLIIKFIFFNVMSLLFSSLLYIYVLSNSFLSLCFTALLIIFVKIIGIILVLSHFTTNSNNGTYFWLNLSVRITWHTILHFFFSRGQFH